MAHVIPVAEINQFLPQDKLEVSQHEAVEELEETARDLVFGRLRAVYDTTGWTVTTTPSLVRSVIALYVAGWLYNRQFADEAVTGGWNTYGDRRIKEAEGILGMLVDGTMTIEDAILIEGVGEGSVHETEPVFEMGTAF